MNRRKFLKFLVGGAAALTLPVPSPAPLPGFIGKWEGFTFVNGSSVMFRHTHPFGFRKGNKWIYYSDYDTFRSEANTYFKIKHASDYDAVK